MNILLKKKHITKKEIKRISWLAKIELSTKEENNLLIKMNQILDFFAKIDEIDTKNIQSSYHVIDLFNIMRNDEPKPSSEETFQIVPQKRGRFVKAPKII